MDCTATVKRGLCSNLASVHQQAVNMSAVYRQRWSFQPQQTFTFSSHCPYLLSLSIVIKYFIGPSKTIGRICSRRWDLGSVHTSHIHGPCSRTFDTARRHSCYFWTRTALTDHYITLHYTTLHYSDKCFQGKNFNHFTRVKRNEKKSFQSTCENRQWCGRSDFLGKLVLDRGGCDYKGAITNCTTSGSWKGKWRWCSWA